MTRPKLRRGFGMIEVLITLLVLSVGVLGVIGMQVSTKKANYEAIQRNGHFPAFWRPVRLAGSYVCFVQKD